MVEPNDEITRCDEIVIECGMRRRGEWIHRIFYLFDEIENEIFMGGIFSL